MKHRQVTQWGVVLLLATLIAVLGLAAGGSGPAAADPLAPEQNGAPAWAGYDMSWWTVDGGGATAAGGGDYSLGGTAGQPEAAVWSGGAYTLAGGFWGATPVEYGVYLPLVVRGDGPR